MNAEIKNESLRTGTAYIDDKVIWTSDETIGGLYTIDKLTFEVRVILDPSQVFKYEKFKIQSIVQWKNYIILVPAKLDQRWVIYDKDSGTVEYQTVVGIHGETAGMCIIGKRGVLVPGSISSPVIIVNLETMTVLRMIRNWNESIEYSSRDFWGTRPGVIVGEEVFFHVYDTRYFVKIGHNSADVFRLQIPNSIASLSYSDNEFWILPTGGNCIYGVDREGKIIEIANLEVNGESLKADDFVRIVSVQKYVFLLPVQGKNFCVYDKGRRKLAKLHIKEETFKNQIPLLCYKTSYWGYCIDINKLYFMPVENKLLEIDLDTLEWKERTVYLPTSMSGRGLWYWFGWCQWCTKGNASSEWDADSIRLYCDMLSEGNAIRESGDSKQGERIWKELKK